MNGRLTGLPTLRVDPHQAIAFLYRGREFHGQSGDTVAVALFDNGVRVFSRSVKYHRPRGLYSLDGESSNCAMEIDGVPNVQTEKTLLQSGMSVLPQNVVGSPETDLLGFIAHLDWAMPAGFYYQTLHRPAWFWPIAMRRIQQLAGVGRIEPSFRMKGVFDEVYPTTDVCVIGGGPAGMCAALAAAAYDLRVILLEARPHLGGMYDHRVVLDAEGRTLHDRGMELASRVEATPRIRVLRHTSLIGIYNNNLVTGFQAGDADDAFDERYVELRARSVVVATGCIERPLLFENNERPGVMQAGCAHRMARTYGVLPGSRSVFSVGHDLGLEAALDLAELGLPVLAVADSRDQGRDEALVEALQAKGISYLSGWVAEKAHGRRELTRVTLTAIHGGARRDFSCDLLVASAGLTPLTAPLTMAGAKPAFDSHTGFFLPNGMPDKMHAAGSMLGHGYPEAIEASGRYAGLEAAADCGGAVESALEEARNAVKAAPGTAGSMIVRAPRSGRKAFVCFDEDTTVKNVKQAFDIGFDVPELSKRFAAVGTGPSQGGVPAHNFPFLLSEYRAEPLGGVVPTTARAPMVPASIATFAGTNHDMHKRTPLHDSQSQAGGIMRRIGVWKRARYFSPDLLCREEIENVRKNVGLIDISTLGKFRIFGPDAEKALQRVYAGNMAKVPTRKLKYSAMCNDDGCLVDDGVVTKRAECDYYLTTSTGRAGVTVEWIRYHTRYDNWDFHIVNLTDAFGVINVAGPNARRVLQKVTDCDVSNEALPFMGYQESAIGDGIPARVCRIGFVGELGYELHVPSSLTQAAWDLLMEAGRECGIRPFGVEAQSCMRLEKGHVIVGTESEIRTTLLDLGMGFLWYRQKPAAKTVGATALRQTADQLGRLKLVGIETHDPEQTPKDGSVVVDTEVRGHVCTARFSFTLSKSIGLAMVEDELAAEGTELEIYQDDWGKERIKARVVKVPFYDPDGERMKT